MKICETDELKKEFEVQLKLNVETLANSVHHCLASYGNDKEVR